jgi:methionine synthase / methylenetetrahydrofolate reductase(NADPH)
VPLEPFLERLKHYILVCDGAMGTMLYSRGIFINRCYDELNLSAPDLVLDVHRAYAAAHADMLETNTYGANRVKLKAYGLEDQVAAINRRGVELARQAAGGQLYVAGALGPTGIKVAPLGKFSQEELLSVYQEQAGALADAGVDLFMLETFQDLNEIVLALRALRKVTDLPVIAQMTYDEEGKTTLGVQPETVVKTLLAEGADVIGANCSVGPQAMLEVIQRLAKAGAPLISAQPNAGNPRLFEGRVLYMSTPEYHAEFARRFIAAGANIVGGCCGTTPEHIKSVSSAVRATQPHKEASAVAFKSAREIVVQPIPREEKSALAARIGKRFAVSVEVLSPRGIDVSQVLAGVRKLAGFGVDAVNIPDGPRASSRMSPSALAQLIERSLPVETILHYCCRDRNLLGMQSDLLGHYALGLRNILIITGDPPKLGDYPDATAVFDVDSIGLTRMVRGLNHGYDVAGNPIGAPTGWHMGVGANPGAIDLGLEIARLEQKVEAGAEYLLTQPIFDPHQMERFFKRTESLHIPVLAGIMPLVSYRTVEFLNNEVPGVVVPDEIGRRLAGAADAESGKKIGIAIAQEAILEVRQFEQVSGLYLMPPFTKDKYDVAIEVLQVIK